MPLDTKNNTNAFKMGKKWKARSFFITVGSYLPVEFQTVLNIFGLVSVTVISYFLWSCLGELDKLRNLNDKVATSFRQTQRSDVSDKILQTDWFNDDSQFFLSVGDRQLNSDFHRSKRDAPRREKSNPDFIYDPFSPTDRVRQFYILPYISKHLVFNYKMFFSHLTDRRQNLLLL